jgi:GntR family transcriptional repressor for pyruvate dehydrogenase complex
MLTDASSRPFAAVRRTSLSQGVLDQLLARMRAGALRPGDRLPGEHALMRQLGVGRSSIREALRGLVVLGLVETRAGRGAVVLARAPSPLAHLASHDATVEQLERSAFLDLLEVRQGLEGQAAELAAVRATPADLGSIGQALEVMESRIARGRPYFEANVRFHLAIARASHNNVLAEGLGHLIRQVRAYRERLMRKVTSMPQRDLVEHREIVEAIRHRQPEEARRRAIQHIRSVGEIVQRETTTPQAAPELARAGRRS